MLQKGDSIGVFQVESRAQINMLPRLKPARFYDLVVQVAIGRPGPIEGDMVHPYLRRRANKEKVEYPSPHPWEGDADELKAILKDTYGVPLFQEQAMKLAIVAAKFTPDEANQLRRAMATFRNVGTIQNFREKMVGGMGKRGYEQDFAERCFKQIEGFGSYGFPESHALSFARLVYVSAWLKCHQPAIFTCALLNAQPMGFYAPAQLVRDARENGKVEVRPVDVNYSGWDNRLGRREDGALAVDRRRRRMGIRDRQERLVALNVKVAVEELHARRALPAIALGLDQFQPAFDALVVESGADLAILLQLEMAIIGHAGAQADTVKEAAAGLDLAAKIDAVLDQAEAWGFRLFATGLERIADRHAVQAVIMAVRDAKRTIVGDERSPDARRPGLAGGVGQATAQVRDAREIERIIGGPASGGQRLGPRPTRQDIVWTDGAEPLAQWLSFLPANLDTVVVVAATAPRGDMAALEPQFHAMLETLRLT